MQKRAELLFSWIQWENRETNNINNFATFQNFKFLTCWFKATEYTNEYFYSQTNYHFNMKILSFSSHQPRMWRRNLYFFLFFQFSLSQHFISFRHHRHHHMKIKIYMLNCANIERNTQKTFSLSYQDSN